MKFRVPANVDMPDRILAGLSLRQLLILAVDGLLIWTLYFAIGRSVTVTVFAAVALVLGAAGLALATSSTHGLGVDRLVFFATRFLLEPKRQVLAPGGLGTSPKISKPSLAPIAFPIYSVGKEGLADLGQHGFAAVCRASGISLALRKVEEQRALMGGFSRLLNSLDAPTQFLIRSERFDLTRMLEDIGERAAGLPHPALEAAARAHLRFLEDLAGQRDVLAREVLVCFREPLSSGEEAGMRLARRIQQAEALLRGFGVTLRRLERDEAARHLRACADPEAPPVPLGADLSNATIIGGAR